MAQWKILDREQSYTFRSYFELAYEPEDILAELGYQLQQRVLCLPEVKVLPDRAHSLQEDIQDSLPWVSLTSETARREIFVAPILLLVARHCRCPLRIEYPLTHNQWLKGHLDYFLRSSQSFLVVEAKKEDLTRGLTQLGAELIAVAEHYDQERVYGAVTIGNVWQFAQIDRANHTITQDLQLYALPQQFEALLKILLGILG